MTLPHWVRKSRVISVAPAPMKNHALAFLEALAHCAPDTLENRFSLVSSRLGLGLAWERNELELLYEATCSAARCNIALNGWAGAGGKIRPEDEPTRSRLEGEFMSARDRLFASPGWQALPEDRQALLRRIFLEVFVAEDKVRP